MRSLHLSHRSPLLSIAFGLVLSLTTTSLHSQTTAQRGPARVNESPAAEHLIDQAEHQLSLEQYGEAAAIFQTILNEYGARLLIQEQGLYIEAAHWVAQRVRQDEALLAAYRNLHEPAAERALNQAKTPYPERSHLEAVRRRYGLCEAGLIAALDLAGMELERAAPQDATLILRRIRDHPDFAAHQKRWRLLEAAAALLQGDHVTFAEHHDIFAAQNDHKSVEQLNRWSASVAPPQRATFHAPWLQLPVSTLLDPLGKPFWVHDLNPSQSANASNQRIVIQGRIIANRMRNGRSKQTMLEVIPVGMGDLLFLNEKTSVTALDRVSGRRLWTYQLNDDTAPAVGENVRRSYVFNVADQRGVAIDGDRLLAVLGLAQTRGRMAFGRRGTQPTVLTCLDRTSGQPLWQVTPEELDGDLAGSSFHGTPLVGGGLAFVLLRHEQAVNFHDIFAAAIRISDGRLAWRRHLITTSTPGRFGWPLTATMGAHEGTLYVSDGMSAAAALSRSDGTILWVRLLADAVRDQRLALTATGDQPGIAPLVVKAGVVVRLMSTLLPAVVLDPQTGEIRERLTDPLWEQVKTIQHLDDDLLITGAAVHRVHGSDVNNIVWTRKLGNNADEIKGWPAVTADRVLVTTDDSLHQLALNDGHTISRDPIDSPGNLLIMDGQVVIAAARRIDSHMAWPWAQVQLQREMKRRPNDPQPGIALARSALIMNEADAVLQGLDHALAAVEHTVTPPQHTDAIQREVFEQILWFLRPTDDLATDDARLSMSDALRGDLLDRLALVVVGPSQQVVYQLEMGNFLVTQKRFEQAADFYQAILDSAELSDELYEHPQGHSLLAGLETKMRLSELIDRAGIGVYARYEAMAAERLDQLRAQPLPDPAALTRIADQYPLARVAAEARIAAAQAFEQRGDSDAAVAQWHTAYRMVSRERPVRIEMIGQIVSRLVSLYEDERQPRRARSWLRTAMREFPGIELLRESQRVTVATWLNLLEDRSVTTDALPRLTLPLGSAFAIPGRLLVPTEQRENQIVRDHIVTARGKSIQYRGGDGLSLIWEYQGPDETGELLALTDDQVLLWFANSGLLLSLDAHTGRPMWGPTPVANLLGVDADLPGEAARRRAALRALQLQGQGNLVINDRQLRTGVKSAGNRPIIRLNDRVISVCHRASGNVMTLDRYSGEVLWNHEARFASLMYVELVDGVLALGGSPVPEADDNRPAGAMRITLHDVETGKLIRQVVEGESILLWMGLANGESLVYLTRNELAAVNVDTGQLKWTQRVERPGQMAAIGLAGDRVILRIDGGAVATVDVASGKLTSPVSVGGGSIMDQIAATAAEGTWQLMTSSSGLCLDADGELRWRDAVFSPAKNLLTQVVGKEHVALLGLSMVEANSDPPYVIYMLDRKSGIMVAEYALGPMTEPIQPDDALMLDHRIVLGTENATIVIPDATAGN